jgi:hypothetical protein
VANALLVAKTIAAFDQFFQPLGETGCRSSIDQIVIEAQRHAHVFADGDLPVDDAWFLGNATQSKIKRMVIDRDAPAGTLAKHAYCRYAHGPTILLLHMRKPALYPPENWPEDSEDHQRQPPKILETFPGLLHRIHLGRPDLVMNLAKGLLIGLMPNAVCDSIVISSRVFVTQV